MASSGAKMGGLGGVGVAVGTGVGVAVAVGVAVDVEVAVGVGLAWTLAPLLPGDPVCAEAPLPVISQTRPTVSRTPQPKPKAMPIMSVSHGRFGG